jgi:hypothetical protein
MIFHIVEILAASPVWLGICGWGNPAWELVITQ